MATLVGAVVALAMLFWAWRHRRVRPMINEVGDELSKVVWPTWDDTKSNTVITVIVTIIISAILALFDLVFKWLTGKMLG
jgi:preprotein translocase subunit SecE